MGFGQVNDLVSIHNVSSENVFYIYLMVLKKTQVKHVCCCLLFSILGRGVEHFIFH